MSDFGDKFTAQGAKLTDRLGDAVTYTAVGAAGATVTAVFQKWPDAGDDKARATFIVASADLASPSTANRRGDRITRGAEIWTVDDYADNADGFLELQAHMPRVIGS